jgi:uncharacterized protein (DUF924 family)
LRASLRVHDRAETPSTIRLKQPSTIAEIRTQAEMLFSQPGLEGALAFEFRHQSIIERFGRFPHRNAILGRESTAEELAFLKTPGSSF